MKKYRRILHYVKGYKSSIAFYFICIFLSIVFSVVSFAMLMPFMDLIFLGGQGNGSALTQSVGNPVIQKIRDVLLNIIQSGVQGKINALLIICAIIFVATFFKNLFIYL